MSNWLDFSFDSSGGQGQATSRPGADRKLGYYKLPGVTALSYSKLKTLHVCPRKFQLQEKQERMEREQNIHTAFGHAFGAGVQGMWKWGTLEGAIWEAMLGWSLDDIDEQDEKANKSFITVVNALQQYWHGQYQELSAEYQIAQLPDGKKAIELFFVINIGDSYNYQGHIDLVLQHRKSGQFCVYEVKTSGKDFYPSQWQNSDQTLGYNVVLDFVGKQETVGNEYRVMYCCLQTKLEELVFFEFSKSKATKANFLTSILLQVKQLELYEEFGFYPKNGDACYAGYGRSCRYFGTCDIEAMGSKQSGNDVYASSDASEVDYFIELDALLEVQEELLDSSTDSDINAFNIDED